ncbi:MAG: C-terminal helicase domain-containing protein, partial [Bacteroidota bacterium]
AGCGFDEEGEPWESKSNKGERDVILKHLEQLLAQNGDLEVGIISPYAAQVKAFREETPFPNVVIQTVDGFQGQERDVIYISLVRSNNENVIGFLKDYRRMNVAMTRAKRKLVVVGDSSTLGNDPFFNEFLDYIEEINAYHSAWEWM